MLPFLFFTMKDGHNSLTKAERKEGWILLFDGQSTKGWHNFKKSGPINSQWKVEEGTLTLAEKGGGDIVTDAEYENFEFRLEWKISEKGNSGIFFNVSEDSIYKAVYHTGPEMQILDDEGHPDGKFPTHRAGANYDLSVPAFPLEKKPGEWNYATIRVQNGNVTYTLNNRVTADYTLWSPQWEELVQKSKFKAMPGYGKMKKGHIALQDHGDRVWFRNIKIRKL